LQRERYAATSITTYHSNAGGSAQSFRIWRPPHYVINYTSTPSNSKNSFKWIVQCSKLTYKELFR
jgi:hypothetical protein